MKERIVDSDHLRRALRRAVKALGLSQNAAARRIGISNSHMSRVLSGEKEPGDKVAGWLGYRPVTRYETRRDKLQPIIHPLRYDNRSA